MKTREAGYSKDTGNEQKSQQGVSFRALYVTNLW